VKTGEYYGTHWYWDEEDREYIICATWYFEQNYPEMPDCVSLEAIEVEEQPIDAPNLDLKIGGAVWKSVYEDGIPMDVKEVDYL
jgi:hypothetical protein